MADSLTNIKSVLSILTNEDPVYLVPDYQRPYAWGLDQCEQLWQDIFDNIIDVENPEDKYFLGPLVVFKNKEKNDEKEVIDGQQRLTTLILLIRAYISEIESISEKERGRILSTLENCVWQLDSRYEPQKDKPRLILEVITDDSNLSHNLSEFTDILKTGKVDLKEQKSNYAINYKFFLDKVHEYKEQYPSKFLESPSKILNDCGLIPIEAESMDSALRIFSTLNNRGLPLSDSDIFKADLYKYYSKKGEKDDFVEKWSALEDTVEDIFDNDGMDELFTRYMYYLRAKEGVTSSTTGALRKFFEKENKKYLCNDNILIDLNQLASFWKAVNDQDENELPEDVLKRFFVLNYAPNSMWAYLVSVYFLTNRNSEGFISEGEIGKFVKFLDKTIAYTLGYSFVGKGVASLRTPFYREMVNIVNGKEMTFSDYKFDENELRSNLESYDFGNRKPNTKPLLAWRVYHFDGAEKQKLLDIDTKFDIEHIYPRKRNDFKPIKGIESIGNKSLLEKEINIRTSDYKFPDRIEYYQGKRGKNKTKTNIEELIKIANDKDDFDDVDISSRQADIFEKFLDFVRDNDLFK